MNSARIFFFSFAILSFGLCEAQSYYEDDFFNYDDTYTAFQSRVGRIINTSERDIGKFSRVTAKVVTVEDMTSKEQISALRLQLESTGSYGYGDIIATIDQDEFDRLLESVKRIHELITTAKSESNGEYVYRTREGMAYGGSNKAGDVKQYLQLVMYNDLTYIHLDEAGYQEFVALLEKAKGMM